MMASTVPRPRRRLRRLAAGSVTLALCATGLDAAALGPAHAEATYAEQEGHHGVDTFTNYHNASGVGPKIDPAAWVNVSCKVYDPYIASVNPGGYWYRIASSPWNDAYYSPANTFMNGDPWNGPYSHDVDASVPDCGTTATPPPAPVVSLAQGPTAPLGYRYAVTLSSFPPSSAVSLACFDSADPSGFYSFSLTTDASGAAFTSSYCFSNQGPDHWVVANGVESNHVSWDAVTGGGSTTPPGSTTPVVPQTTPAPTVHGPAVTNTSGNWIGYTAAGSGMRKVQATWTVPTVTCNGFAGYTAMAMWAGIDDAHTDLVQAGTSAVCKDGNAAPIYYSWWESLPALNTPVGTVHPGDTISLAIYVDPGAPDYRLIGMTVNGKLTIGRSVPSAGASNNMAECIVEAPQVDPKNLANGTRNGWARVVRPFRQDRRVARTRNGSGGSLVVAPLAQFTPATFTRCAVSTTAVTGQEMGLGSLNGIAVTRLNGVTKAGTRKATAGLASDDGSTWTVTWAHV